VRAALLPFLDVGFPGNPHSGHVMGRRASEAVEIAREQVAALIGAQAGEIVFTSGATESNNLALQGLARARNRRGNHIITFATEHKCVLETVSYLGNNGFDIEVLPVGQDGLIDIRRFAETVREDTFLVSVMAANNEIGVLQPLEQITVWTIPSVGACRDAGSRSTAKTRDGAAATTT
jgi:cysteine desulfurase